MRLAVLGDLHGRFDPVEAGWLDRRGYRAVLVVGDVGGGGEAWREGLAALRTPAFLVPGNHDGVSFPHLAAEIVGPAWLAERWTSGMDARIDALARAVSPVRLVGYERLDLGAVQVVVGRPHTLGGPGHAFASHLARRYGVPDGAASAERLTELLRACDDRPVVVLAHNGPHGLGDRRTDPFGRDFHADEGDWGDTDLAQALDAAAAAGRRVDVVVAGHMHHALRGGGTRRTWGRRGATLVVNAARVPRVERDGARHLVELEVTGGGVAAWAVRVRGDEEARSRLG